MKRHFWLPLLLGLALLPSLASVPWLERFHEVAENIPSRGEAVKTLGRPDKVASMVTNGGPYTVLQPMMCAELPAGVRLEVLSYNGKPRKPNMPYRLFFRGDEIQCAVWVFTEQAPMPRHGR